VIKLSQKLQEQTIFVCDCDQLSQKLQEQTILVCDCDHLSYRETHLTHMITNMLCSVQHITTYTCNNKLILI
jgi:hypothetical protein